MCLLTRAHTQPWSSGRRKHSDKQLWCYKGGRKSIKPDNKIAIEFLLLFYIADACIFVTSARCNYLVHRQVPCTIRTFVSVCMCVSHILLRHGSIHTQCMCEIVFLDECWVLLLEPRRNHINLVQLWRKRQLQPVANKESTIPAQPQPRGVGRLWSQTPNQRSL